MSEKRDAIVDRLADHVLASGLAGSSLRPLAAAAGLSDRMLLYHFDNKADVMAAAIDRVAERLRVDLDRHASGEALPLERLTQRIVPIVLSSELWPYIRLWLEIVAAAALGDEFYRATGARIAEGFLAWCAGQIDSADEVSRGREAARLLVMIEGAALLHAIGQNKTVDQAISPDE